MSKNFFFKCARIAILAMKYICQLTTLLQVCLLGHGLGGLVAWHFVDRHPSSVDKMVLVSAPHPASFRDSVAGSWEAIKRNR